MKVTGPLSLAIAAFMVGCATSREPRWDERPSVTWTESDDYLDSVSTWHTGEYLSSSGPVNLKGYVSPEMVDELPKRIKQLRVGMKEADVRHHLSRGYGYAWGYNTASHGMESIPEGHKPQEITFRYKLTEINAERTASRSRFDLLIHWKCDYSGDGMELTYLDAKLIPPRKG